VSAPPGQWTEQEISLDVETAIDAFRERRFAEPLAIWQSEVDERIKQFSKLFEEHGMARPAALSSGDVIRIIEAGLLDPMRYLPGPPISADDLKNLAEVNSLNPRTLRANREAALRLLETIRASIDPRRFPWLAENRDPTPQEKDAAIFASALMFSAQRLLTLRRTLAKTEQERQARDELKAHGFHGERLKRIRSYAQFPTPGVVSENEVQFGPERADVVARLWNDRMMPIECKVSNSEVNSYKRLNHDTLAKHTAWIDAFGRSNVTPAALLAGVYSPANVIAAQNVGLTIFWSHRMSDLGGFVDGTNT